MSFYKAKRIAIISYLDYPMPTGISRRISGIAASLRDAKFDVEIVSPIFRTSRRTPSDGIRVDMRFLRVFGPERLPTKILALLLFNLFAFVKILASQSELLAIQYESIYSYPAAFLARMFGSRCPCIGDDILLAKYSKLSTLQAFLALATDLVLSSTKPRPFGKSSKMRTLHVPTGVNESFVLERSSKFEKIRAVFVGALSYHANLSALNNLFRTSLGLDECEFLVVGGPVPEELSSSANVKLLGVLDDSSLLHVYREANVGVLPFFGIPAEGPKVKLLDYLAAQLLVISSSNGVEGYPDLVPWEHYIPAQSVEELGRLLKGIPARAAVYAQIAKEGHEFAMLNYQWPALLAQYITFMEKLRLDLNQPSL